MTPSMRQLHTLAHQFEINHEYMKCIEYYERLIIVKKSTCNLYNEENNSIKTVTYTDLIIKCNEYAMLTLKELKVNNSFHLLNKAQDLMCYISNIYHLNQLKAITYNNIACFYKRY